MPLFKISGKHLEIPVHGLYTFAEEHKEDWHKFWINMQGDIDKILDFAKDLGIESPKDWLEELHRFLFDIFSGSYRMITASNNLTFNQFLKGIIENHKKSPKTHYWYACHDTDLNGFIKIFEIASEFDDYKEAINHINARIRDFGSKVFNEWVLTKAKESGEIKSIATNKIKEMNKLERTIFGARNFKIGEKINYFGFNDSLEITEICMEPITKISFKDLKMCTNKNYLLCKDSLGLLHKINNFDLIF
jgi:hypothetical protein